MLEFARTRGHRLSKYRFLSATNVERDPSQGKNNATGKRVGTNQNCRGEYFCVIIGENTCARTPTLDIPRSPLITIYETWDSVRSHQTNASQSEAPTYVCSRHVFARCRTPLCEFDSPWRNLSRSIDLRLTRKNPTSSPLSVGRIRSQSARRRRALTDTRSWDGFACIFVRVDLPRGTFSTAPRAFAPSSTDYLPSLARRHRRSLKNAKRRDR